MTHALKCVPGFTTEGVGTKTDESTGYDKEVQTVMDEEIHFWELFLVIFI